MQDVRPFIQLFRYDLSSPDHDHFEKVIINTKNIVLVEWHEDWKFVAIVCETDHPEGRETFIEDYNNEKVARNRYQHILTLLGANDGSACEREGIMKKAAKENYETDEWIRQMFIKAAGQKKPDDEEEQEEDEDE